MAPWVTMPVDGAGEDGPAPAPLCPHFGTCGGCAAQDLGDAAYRSWKRGFVEAALRRACVEAEVAAPVSVPPASRRRARFFAARSASGLSLGFHARASHDVVDHYLVRFADAYQNQLQDFVETILADRPPRVTGHDGRQALAVALAAERSHRESRPVSLKELVGDPA